MLQEVTFTNRHPKKRTNKNAFTDTNVVITGTLSTLTRKQAHELLSLMGANPGDSVTHDTDYLIVGADPGGRKVAKALQYGTSIIYEREFAEMLENQA